MKKSFKMPVLRVISTDIIATDAIKIVSTSNPGTHSGLRAPERIGAPIAPQGGVKFE